MDRRSPVIAVVLSVWAAVSSPSLAQTWEPENILALLKAREQATPALDVRLVIEEGPCPEWRKYVEARKESNRALRNVYPEYAPTELSVDRLPLPTDSSVGAYSG